MNKEVDRVQKGLKGPEGRMGREESGKAKVGGDWERKEGRLNRGFVKMTGWLLLHI